MHRLARLSLAQRSLVALATLIIAVAGVFATTSLKQELIPSIEFPQVSVLTSYPGSSPEIVDEQVSQPLSNALSSLDGLESITATSSTGMSSLNIAFDFGTDLDDAQAQIDQAIAGLNGQLPEGVTPKTLAGSADDFPVVSLAVSSDADLTTLNSQLETIAIPDIQEVDGVREATLAGGATQEITITPDADKLAAAGLTTQSISDALQANGQITPAGSLTEDGETLSIQAGTAISSLDQLEDIPLLPQPTSQTGDAPAVSTLGEVATVVLADPERTSITRTNGEESLSLSVTKTPDGDSVGVSHAIADLIPELEDDLGQNAEISVVFDQAPFIEKSIEDLTTEGLLGLGFAIVVILIFLMSVRSTLVTAISIPVSLLITMGGLYVGGYSLNILTLGALTIAIGRVVDDSIVVIENIKRHLSYGEPKRQAILAAVKEVATAITASTLTTVAVFVPIAIVGGMVGELFQPFAITVAIALLSSLLVALTIVPVLAYWFLKAPKTVVDAEKVRLEAEEKENNSRLQSGYLPIIGWTQRHPAVTVVAALAILAGTLALVPRLETDFLGDSGQNTMSVTQEMPAGTDLDTLTDAAVKVEDELLDTDGIENVQVTIGSSTDGQFFGMQSTSPISFTVTTDAEADQQAIQDRARERIDELSGVGEVTIGGAAGGGFGGSSTVDVEITATDESDLTSANDEILSALDDVEGSLEVDTDLAAAQPTLEVAVDRQKAADAGLTESQVSGLVASVLNPQSIGTVHIDDTELSISIEPETKPATLDAVRELEIPAATGMIPLSDVATVERVEVPPSITSTEGDLIATVSVTPDADVAVGTLSTTVQTELDDLDLPSGVTATIGGVSADQQESFTQLGLALVVAIAIVYLLMVATFRSLLQPLILLVSIPFAATGALGLLLATGTPLGIAALIGMLMLVGIVVTNAIVLIDLVNQYRAQGQSVRDAVMNGARQRLRPILMTALATIFALTPMALGLTGGGGFISQPLAMVVIGGLVSSTALTLILVPVLYLLVEGAKERRSTRSSSQTDIGTSARSRKQQQADRMLDLERENLALKRMVADSELRQAALVEAGKPAAALPSANSSKPSEREDAP